MPTASDYPPGTRVESCIRDGDWHKGVITDAPPANAAVLNDLAAGMVCVKFDKSVEDPLNPGTSISYCTYEPDKFWRIRLDHSRSDPTS